VLSGAFYLPSFLIFMFGKMEFWIFFIGAAFLIYWGLQFVQQS